MPNGRAEAQASDSLSKLILWLIGLQLLLIVILVSMILPVYWHTTTNQNKQELVDAVVAKLKPELKQSNSSGLTAEQFKKQMDKLLCEVRKNRER